MGIGAGIGLIAVGAVLAFALPEHLGPIRIGTIGVILMVVGAIGLALTTFIWGPRRGRPIDPRDDVVEERRIVGPRRYRSIDPDTDVVEERRIRGRRPL